MSLKEYVVHELELLDETRLRQVADYVSRLRVELQGVSSEYDADALARLYAEFAEEDRVLAEEGMADYAQRLDVEDRQ